MLVKDFEVAQGFGVELNSGVELNFGAAPNFEAEQDFGVAYDCETGLNFANDSSFVFVRDPVAGVACDGGDCPEAAEHEAVCGAWQREAGRQGYEAVQGTHSA